MQPVFVKDAKPCEGPGILKRRFRRFFCASGLIQLPLPSIALLTNWRAAASFAAFSSARIRAADSVSALVTATLKLRNYILRNTHRLEPGRPDEGGDAGRPAGIEESDKMLERITAIASQVRNLFVYDPYEASV